MFKPVIRSISRNLPLLSTIRTYSWDTARRDLVAALTVAVVAIPQSMAYAIIAGVDPVYGLYTAIVSTIFSALFGSSEHLIAGPTNAISLLVASAMKNFAGADNFYETLFLLTFIVGILQILFGVIRLGKLINYVSHAVIVGFTAGAGVLIALGQFNHLLGISPDGDTLSPVLKAWQVVQNLEETNLFALGLGVLTIGIILAGKKISKNLPGSLIGIFVSILCVVIFALDRQSVKLVGEIPATLPPFRMISLDYGLFRQLFGGALPIAIIGLVEAISIAKSIASSSGQKINANREFIGQGIANTASSFFQCFAGSGSFTRSAINYFNGAKTRLAGVASGFICILILLFGAPYARFIPKASLAGVIMVIAYSMVNLNEMKKVRKTSRSDAWVMWITFGATVLMPDLDWAIYMGIAISTILYMKDTNKVPVKILLPVEEGTNRFCERETSYIQEKVDILIVQLEGNLYFGSASDLESKLESVEGKARVYILRMKTVSTIDMTALDVIRIFIRRTLASGSTILVCGLKTGLNTILINSDLSRDIGAEHIFLAEEEIFASSAKALKLAKEIITDSL